MLSAVSRIESTGDWLSVDHRRLRRPGVRAVPGVHPHRRFRPRHGAPRQGGIGQGDRDGRGRHASDGCATAREKVLEFDTASGSERFLDLSRHHKGNAVAENVLPADSEWLVRARSYVTEKIPVVAATRLRGFKIRVADSRRTRMATVLSMMVFRRYRWR